MKWIEFPLVCDDSAVTARARRYGRRRQYALHSQISQLRWFTDQQSAKNATVVSFNSQISGPKKRNRRWRQTLVVFQLHRFAEDATVCIATITCGSPLMDLRHSTLEDETEKKSGRHHSHRLKICRHHSYRRLFWYASWPANAMFQRNVRALVYVCVYLWWSTSICT